MSSPTLIAHLEKQDGQSTPVYMTNQPKTYAQKWTTETSQDAAAFARTGSRAWLYSRPLYPADGFNAVVSESETDAETIFQSSIPLGAIFIPQGPSHRAEVNQVEGKRQSEIEDTQYEAWARDIGVGPQDLRKICESHRLQSLTCHPAKTFTVISSICPEVSARLYTQVRGFGMSSISGRKGTNGIFRCWRTDGSYQEYSLNNYTTRCAEYGVDFEFRHPPYSHTTFTN